MAVALRDLVDERFDRRRVGHVAARGADVEAGGAQLGFGRLQPLGTSAGDRHRRAGLGQPLGDLTAQPARAAGDERHPAGQVEERSDTGWASGASKRVRGAGCVGETEGGVKLPGEPGPAATPSPVTRHPTGTPAPTRHRPGPATTSGARPCPARKSPTLSAASCRPASSASGVTPALCGVKTVLGAVRSGLSGVAGSTLKTSRPAPAMRPSCSASASAASSTQALARGVNQQRRRLHQRQLGPADHLLGRRGEAHMDRDDVGRLQQFLLADVAQGDLGRQRLVRVEAPGDDVHADAPAEHGHPRPDRAGAEDAERLTVERADHVRAATRRP